LPHPTIPLLVGGRNQSSRELISEKMFCFELKLLLAEYGGYVETMLIAFPYRGREILLT
jgi:hypothetical protein